MTTTHDIDQIDRKLTDIGSSDSGPILGLLGADARKRLLMVKRGDIPPERPNARMRCGTHMEPWIRDEWIRESGVVASDYEKPAKKFVHPDIPWMTAHLDLLSRDGKHLVEFKSSGTGRAWQDRQFPGTLTIPAYTTSQVQHAACVVQTVETITVVGWIADELYVEDLMPYPELWDTIIEAESAFHDCVVDRSLSLPPACLDDVREMWGDPEPEKAIPMTPEIHELLVQLSRDRKERSSYGKSGSAGKRIAQLEFELAQAMGDAGAIADERGSPVYVRSMRAGYPVAAYEARPCEVARFTKWWKT